jgi:hypothetical protein
MTRGAMDPLIVVSAPHFPARSPTWKVERFAGDGLTNSQLMDVNIRTLEAHVVKG